MPLRQPSVTPPPLSARRLEQIHWSLEISLLLRRLETSARFLVQLIETLCRKLRELQTNVKCKKSMGEILLDTGSKAFRLEVFVGKMESW